MNLAKTSSDTIYYPDIGVDPLQIIKDIADIAVVPLVIANLTYQYTLSPFPKIQGWNMFPYHRVTLRLPDDRLYFLDGEKGLIGPLEIEDEKRSLSLNVVTLSVHRTIVKSKNGLKFVAKLDCGKVAIWDIHDDEIQERPDPLILQKNQKGDEITDAETIITMWDRSLTLTRSGDLYCGDEHLICGVRSVIPSLYGNFAAILDSKDPHEYYYYCILNGNGSCFGPLTDGFPMVHASTTCVKNELGFAFLLKNGRIRTEPFGLPAHFPKTLRTRLKDPLNYVESLVASRYHYAAILKLEDGTQEVYIWGVEVSFFVETSIYPNPRFRDSESIELKRTEEKKKIANMVAGSGRGRSETGSTDAFAVNFEDGASSVMVISDAEENAKISVWPLSASVQTLYPTRDGILIVHESEAAMYDREGTRRAFWDEFSSYAIGSDGSYLILQFKGKYSLSRGSVLPAGMRSRIDKAEGIAEIYSCRGYYWAILMNGTVVTWKEQYRDPVS